MTKKIRPLYLDDLEASDEGEYVDVNMTDARFSNAPLGAGDANELYGWLGRWLDKMIDDKGDCE